MQEVTTTSTIDGASTHPVRQPKQQHLSADGAAAAEECDLDPITGMLVTKDGSPFSVDKLVGETKSIEQSKAMISFIKSKALAFYTIPFNYSRVASFRSCWLWA